MHRRRNSVSSICKLHPRTITIMAFKLVILASFLALANAGLIGAPAAVATYSAAPAVSTAYIHHAPVAVAQPLVQTYAAAPISYGATHQSVERSLGGAQSVSHYSKAVDSAFSSVRKYDTRITNDALTVAHAPVLAKAVAPALTYSTGPVYAKAPAYAYSAGPVYAKAPAYAYSSAPGVSSSYIQHASAPVVAQAPIVTKTLAPAPVVQHYSAAPVVQHYSAAPVVHHYAAAPVLQQYAAGPVVAKTYAAHAAPLTVSAGPVVTKAAVAYSPATVVSHTTFTGLGTAYQW